MRQKNGYKFVVVAPSSLRREDLDRLPDLLRVLCYDASSRKKIGMFSIEDAKNKF